MKSTNAVRSLENVLRREVRFRASGHWPTWRWQDVPDGVPGASGWSADVRRVAENGVFVVLVRDLDAGPFGKLQHAMISTLSMTEVTWGEKMRIKDELFGRERTAIEVFPPVSELIDEANAYHLWVFPPGTLLPFTLARRPAQ
jgi:hypothetical protein